MFCQSPPLAALLPPFLWIANDCLQYSHESGSHRPQLSGSSSTSCRALAKLHRTCSRAQPDWRSQETAEQLCSAASGPSEGYCTPLYASHTSPKSPCQSWSRHARGNEELPKSNHCWSGSLRCWRSWLSPYSFIWFFKFAEDFGLPVNLHLE